MRIFLCRIGTLPVRLLFMLLACHILACGDKAVDPQESLDTSPHERTGAWEGTPIQADIMWRFTSAEPFSDRIAVTGAWTITFHNTGVNDYLVDIGKFSFEDNSGFQITEYTPISPQDEYIDSFIINNSQTQRRTGNFEIYVDSVDIANSITQINVYLAISQL